MKRLLCKHRNGNSPKLWDRTFVFLNLSFFLVFTNIAFLYLYPLTLDAMGENHHVIGWVMGIFSFAAVISRPFMGKLVALTGEYRVMSCGLAAILLATMGYTLIKNFGPGMLGIRVIHGIGFSAFISGSFSMAAKGFHPNKRGEAFSIVGVALMGAIALAPPFGEFLIHKWGFHALYIAASGSITLAWIAVLIATKPLPPSPRIDKNNTVRYLPLLKNRSFVFLLVSTFFFAHCQATVPNFLALIATENGVSSGPFFFMSYFMAILVLITMGKFIDQYGKLPFIILAYPFFSIGILFIPVMIRSYLFLIPAILYGVGMGLLFPSHNALAAGHGSKNEKPAIMSLFTAVYDTGFITGAVVSGWLAAVTSLDILFFACGVFGCLGFLIVIVSPIKEI